MATRTTAQSGLWSATSTWVDGVKPAAGDAVVIAAGHVLTQDEDASVASVTITSHATTPGRLTVSSNAGTYTLTITSTTGIVGTNAAVKGQLYAGTAENPVPNNIVWHFDLGDSGTINATYLDVKLYCTQPTHRYVRLSADEDTGQTVLSVDTDVTGDIWADGDTVGIGNDNSGGPDWQLTTIAAGGISASEITVADALDSKNVAGSYIVRVTRNVRITFSGNNRSVQNGNGAVLQCEIQQTSASSSGYGVYQGNGHTFSGSTFTGCGYGVYQGSGHMVSGSTFSGCTSGVYQGSGHTVSGSTFSGCTSGVYQGSVTILAGTTFAGNSRDIYASNARIIGYGASLGSATQVAVYNTDNVQRSGGVLLYDVAGSPGRIKSWTRGGTIASVEWADVPAGVQTDYPGPTPDCLHLSTFENADYTDWFEWPIFARAGVPVTVTLYCRLQQTGMTQRLRVSLCDPQKLFEDEAEAVAVATAADNTDWQTLTITYTPAADNPLVVRVGGRNSSGTAYWQCAIRQDDLPAVADVRYGVDYDGEAKSGICHVPTAAQTELGVLVDVAGTGTFTHTDDYVGKVDVVAADWVVVGHDNYVGGQTGTYPTTAVSKAEQLAEDQAAIDAAKADIKSTRTILTVTGTLDMSLYTLISGVVDADYVVIGHDNYVGGQTGTYPTSETSKAEQLAADQAEVLAAAEWIVPGHPILGQDGTLDYPTELEIAEAVWTWPDRILT